MAALYFEDLYEGQSFVTPGRTITEADLLNFAGVSGDFNSIHTDAQFVQGTQYSQRVVYGVLGLSVMTGLMDRLGIFSGSAIAMLGIDNWRFRKPLFIGDTITARITISKLRLTSDGRRGIVDRWIEIINQNNDVVQDGQIGLMIRVRADSIDGA